MKITYYYYSHCALSKLLQCKAACVDNFCSFSLAPLQNCSHFAPTAYPHTTVVAGLFHNNVLPAADHTEILDVGAQQGLLEESGPERVW